jgi:hypothetical protein
LAGAYWKKGQGVDNLRRLFHSSHYVKCVKTWKKAAGKEDREKFDELHKDISAYIRNHCRFIVFPVEKEFRECWEKKIISTISTCPECGPSPNWLGNIFPLEIQPSCNKIRESGLWNIDHVNNQNILTDDEIAAIEKIVERLGEKSI